MEDIWKFIEPYVAFDKPVEYEGFKIYPIKTKDYYEFVNNYVILRLEKNKIPDIQIIQMSYLEYLFGLICENEDARNSFFVVLKLSFGIEFSQKKMVPYNDPITNKPFKKGQMLQLFNKNSEVVRFYINGYGVQFIIDNNKIYLLLSGKRITATQFDEIIRIIFYQNDYSYDDTPMSADFKRVIDEYYSLKNKGLITPNIEDKMIDIMSQTGLKKNELCEMPLRTIDKLLSTIQDAINYQIAHTYNLLKTEKVDIDDWVIKKKRERYSEVFSNADEMENKFK